MNFDLSDEQRMLAEQARGLLGERSSPERPRESIADMIAYARGTQCGCAP